MRKKIILIIGGLIIIGLETLYSFSEPPSQQPFSEGNWLNSLEEAQKIAAKEGKDILVGFVGSDWCKWCIKLDKEVFSTDEWKKKAPRKYVQVLIDFPRDKKLKEEEKSYNKTLKLRFRVQGYPAVLLLDSKGNPYARTGYQEGGAEKYLEHLKSFEARKKERDNLLEKIKEEDKDNRLKNLEKTVDKLTEWEVESGYPELQEEIVSLDKDNKAGLQLKYAEKLAYYHGIMGNNDKSNTYFEVVKKIDPAKAKNLEVEIKLFNIQSSYLEDGVWEKSLEPLTELAKLTPTGETAQNLYYIIALVYHQLGKKDEVIKNLEKALEAASESERGQQIKETLQRLKQAKEPKK